MKPPHLLPRHGAPLVDEHATLCRQLGGLQRRVSALLLQHEIEVRRLDGETVRLRAQLLVARTALLWGLPRTASQPKTQPEPRRPAHNPHPSTWPQAREVMCQVACTGHAHPWLDAQGHCSRDGQVCTGLPDRVQD